MMSDARQRLYSALSSIFPKTVGMLMQETGLSYQTVKTYLEELNAVELEQFSPKHGRAKTYMRPRQLDDDTITILLSIRPEVVRSWRRIREQVSEDVRALTITPSADPVWLADQFIETGKLLLELGAALDRHKMEPDWYYQLGGKLWLEEDRGA